MKQRKKRLIKQLVSWGLCVSMLVPNTAPIVAEAATMLGNMPRSVDFSRPEALTLGDLGLASGSNVPDIWEQPDDEVTDEEDLLFSDKELVFGGDDWILSEDEIDGVVHIATSSDADYRDPEFFYEGEAEEPDGVLVQFNNAYRTYLVEENVGTDDEGNPIHSYVTVVGDSPYMYADPDGSVHFQDNTLMPVSRKTKP